MSHTTSLAFTASTGDAHATCACGWAYGFWAATRAEAETIPAAHLVEVRREAVEALPLAHRRVFDALAEADRPMTPADLKRALPGAVPVATLRSVLGRLFAADLVEAAEPHPGTNATTYRATTR